MASSTCDVRRRAARVALATLALVGTAARPSAAHQPAPGGASDLLAPDSAEAAEPVATLPDGTRRIAGRVVAPRESATVGVPGIWVTLHRVGSDAAGPLDSVRTDAAGRYAMRFRPRGDTRAVYFVAASRGGVAYFGAPITKPVVEGQDAELTVFDTTSSGGHVHATGRHLIVSRPGPGGARDVLEVFELANDSSVTFVPPTGAGRGVWATPLPAGATNFAARENSDVPTDGLVMVGGRATLMVPVAPGLKQVAFSYRLPPAAFPLRVPIEPRTGVLEVLLEEPRATAMGAGLATAGPVALEGKTFQRFLAQSANAGGTVDVRVEGATPDDRWPRYAVPLLLLLVGGSMAAVLVVASTRRRGRAAAGTPSSVAPGRTPAVPADASDRDRLLAELAALDDARPGDAATPAERAAYEARRAAVKTQLAAELAGAGGGR